MSVDQCADEVFKSQLDHVDRRTGRLFAVLFGVLTLIPCGISRAEIVANYCTDDDSNMQATYSRISFGVESIDDTPNESSWIFFRSRFTNDPRTGARVAQYERKPPIEPLDDPRKITSSYRRTRTNLRGLDGSYDDAYQVQAWGNGRGGLDAEWERFDDAWKESVLQGSYYNGPVYGPYGNGGYGYGGRNNQFGGAGYGNNGWGMNGPGPSPGGWGPGNGGGQEFNGMNNRPMNDGWQRNGPNRQWQND